MTSTSFAGSNILVTGASRGIGRAIAQGFAKAGSSVAITGRKSESIQAAARELGDSVSAHVCHQGDPSQIAELFATLDDQWNKLDVVIINAATNPVMSPLAKLDLAAWNKTLQVNLTGAFLTAQAAAVRMTSQASGVILFISSIAAYESLPGLGIYAISKSALNALTHSLARELGASGVRVNAIAPGLIETKFSEGLMQHKPTYDHIIASTPLRRHGQPSDIVEAAMYLASDSASFVTGQILVVDGGMVMR